MAGLRAAHLDSIWKLDGGSSSKLKMHPGMEGADRKSGKDEWEQPWYCEGPFAPAGQNRGEQPWYWEGREGNNPGTAKDLHPCGPERERDQGPQ